jgi:hypothetical protein
LEGLAAGSGYSFGLSGLMLLLGSLGKDGGFGFMVFINIRRPQIDFGFWSELDNGKVAKLKKSKKAIENEIEILEQLVFDIEHANLDGTSLSDSDAVKYWLQSKINALKQE